jgi:hypothetical protein
MATKIRKQVYLEARQDRLLKREAKARGLSEAEVLRRLIDAALPRVTRGGTNPAALDAFLEFARERAAKGPLPGKREWTREGLYEERLARYGKRLPARH